MTSLLVRWYVSVLHLTGETDDIRIERCWKDGRPTLVEASHVIERVAAPPLEEDAEAEAEG
jgi:hypothetical protein